MYGLSHGNKHLLLSKSIRCNLRCLATAGEPTDYHAKYDLHQWPKSKSPTPYEIFGISPDKQNLSVIEFNQLLKKIYTSYVKIYHPDVLKNLVIYDKKNKVMTDQMKRERFDQILNAYETLKDPKRRVAYNRYENASWETHQRGSSSFEAYRKANAHRKQYKFENDEEFWRASSWEDYYHMKFKRDPPTMEELEKNKLKILGYVILVASLVFGLQMLLVLRRTSEHDRQASLATLQSLRDLNQSYTNYGEGETRFQRIKRFLLQRRSSIAQPDNADDLKELDNELLVKYAQQKVEKF